MHLHGETHLGIPWEEQLARAAHPRGTIRYEIRLAYIKAGQMKEKLLQRL
jgi:hypothetical protein